jgi:hypothetical protein
MIDGHGVLDYIFHVELCEFKAHSFRVTKIATKDIKYEKELYTENTTDLLSRNVIFYDNLSTLVAHLTESF